MARLRVNGVSGLIGPNQISLTTSTTTTVSWAVAPGFATLTGSDYYVIIVNPNTLVQEIIYLTAYTSGSTSGTCLRAQEGTSGAAFTGTNWVHGPTAYDFSATHAVVKTSAYSANSGDSVMATSGTFTVTLPPPFLNALVKVTNYGSGVVSVSHNASELIYGLGCGSSGQTTIPLGAYGATVTLESLDGGNWFITAGAQDSGWIAWSYVNSWADDAGGSGGPVSGYRLQGNTVRTRGCVINGTNNTAINNAIATNYCPTGNLYPASVNSAGGSVAVAYLVVSTSGVITARFTGTLYSISLDGVTWTVD